MKIKKIIDKEINAPSPSSKLLQEVENLAPKKSRPWIFGLVSGAAACCAILIGVLVFFFSQNGVTSPNINAYNVVISINPAVMLTTNSSGVVTSQKALNADGVKLILNEDFTSLNIDDATKKVVNLSKQHGYLDANGNIRVRITDDKGNITSDKEQSLIDSLVGNNVVRLSDLEFDNIFNTYDEDELEELSTETQKQFVSYLIKLLDEKMDDINNLVCLLKPIFDNADDDEPLILDNVVSNSIRRFIEKYKIKIIEFDFDNIKELYENLLDQIEDYQEIRSEINDNNVEEFEDLLEDLMEIAKEEIIDD